MAASRAVMNLNIDTNIRVHRNQERYRDNIFNRPPNFKEWLVWKYRYWVYRRWVNKLIVEKY